MSCTWAVSLMSQISNNRNSAHSVAPIRCFWSAFFAEKVCTVMFGQSSCRSKSSSRRLVTKRRMSDAGSGFKEGGFVVVLRDMVRDGPLLVVVVMAVEDVEVGRDMTRRRYVTISRVCHFPVPNVSTHGSCMVLRCNYRAQALFAKPDARLSIALGCQ